MCDEYDDERMRAFWRALAEREEIAKLDSEADDSKPLSFPVVPVGENLEPRHSKPRALLH